MEKWNSLVQSSMALPVPPVLVRVISQQGSAPRTAGARMLVREKDILGTVGGGLYEAQAIDVSRQLQQEHATGGKLKGGVIRFSLYGVEDMDMVCGGELCLLFELLEPDSANAEVISKAATSENNFKDFSLLSAFGPVRHSFMGKTPYKEGAQLDGQGVDSFLRALPQGVFCPVWVDTVFCSPDEKQVAGAHYPSLFSSLPQAVTLFREPGFVQFDEVREIALDEVLVGHEVVSTLPYYFADPFPAPHVVHIFGGGHVSKALADCLVPLSFGVVVLEDREEFITPTRFPLAKTVNLPSLAYEEIQDYLNTVSPEAHHAIVIMTRGHAFDRDVLAAALESRAGYLGMIGSKRKWVEVQKQLVKAGVSQAVLDEVHTPIGLSIGAETPEEIGVSIAAELIAWRCGTDSARKVFE